MFRKQLASSFAIGRSKVVRKLFRFEHDMLMLWHVLFRFCHHIVWPVATILCFYFNVISLLFENAAFLCICYTVRYSLGEHDTLSSEGYILLSQKLHVSILDWCVPGLKRYASVWNTWGCFTKWHDANKWGGQQMDPDIHPPHTNTTPARVPFRSLHPPSRRRS